MLVLVRLQAPLIKYPRGSMTEKRRPFCDIPKEESDMASHVGKATLETLFEHFGAKNDKSCDLVCNSLVAALIYFIKLTSEPDDYPIVMQLIHTNIKNNLGMQ